MSSKNQINQGMIIRALDWAYDKAINGGMPGLYTSYELALKYKNSHKDAKSAAKSLVRWQVAKCGSNGFISGVPGFIISEFPPSVINILYEQIIMIMAIAVLGGHDLNDDRVKAMVYMCIAGKSIKEINLIMGLKDRNIFMTKELSNFLSKPVITEVNKAVASRLVFQFSSKGITNVIRILPIISGVSIGFHHALTTRIIGKLAIKMFIEGDL